MNSSSYEPYYLKHTLYTLSLVVPHIALAAVKNAAALVYPGAFRERLTKVSNIFPNPPSTRLGNDPIVNYFHVVVWPCPKRHTEVMLCMTENPENGDHRASNTRGMLVCHLSYSLCKDHNLSRGKITNYSRGLGVENLQEKKERVETSILVLRPTVKI